MTNFIYKLNNWYFKRHAMPYWTILAADLLIVFFSFLVAYIIFRPGIMDWIELGFSSELLSLVGFFVLRVMLCMVGFIIGFRVFRSYAGIIRYSSFADLLRVAGAASIGGVFSWLVHFPLYTYSHFHTYLPDAYKANIRTRDIIVATLLSIVIMWFMRVVVKSFYDKVYKRGNAIAAYIFGTEENAIAIAKKINSETPKRFLLKGFIAEKEYFTKHTILGYNTVLIDDEVVEKMTNSKIKALIIGPEKMKDFRRDKALQAQLIDAGIRLYMVPPVQQMNAENANNYAPKEVKIEDLLERDEIQIDLDAVGALLRGKSIMVTGAAGSIGSEIARQVASFAPSQLILIDQAETPMHDVRLFMANNHASLAVQTIVTDVCKADRMAEIFRETKPEVVFHAAAYKHVPMMEDNPCEAIQNNVYSTQVLADLAVKHGTKKFVMVSTDKAVNPSSVMGCSKRICEIYVQALDKAIKEGKMQGQTQFVTTRFGNVLGSNGSVIPLFHKQIAKGGPLTVTHPDIVRYFMLIPEACKLVLEAGTKGKGGEIFVFDMGEPVKIVDLAKRMIKMNGRSDIEIKFTGLRDGEKPFEQLLNENEISHRSEFHEMVHVAKVREYDIDAIRPDFERLHSSSHQFDAMHTVRIMKEMVPEFKSMHSVYENLDNTQ